MKEKEKFEEAKRLYKDANADQRYVLERLFPQLIESEDEKIRKEIIALIDWSKSYHASGMTNDDAKKMLAWLEKQGEQKTTVDTKVIIPKFRVGDIVKSKSQPMLTPRKIISISKDCYFCEDRGCIGFAWEDDYVIVEQKHAAWSEKDEHWRQKTVDFIKHPDLIRATPTLAQGCKDWLKSLKNKVQLQPSQEWGEEDERLIQIIIDILDRENHLGHISHTDLIACVRKLKSLKPQSTWKPSDEQMEALKHYVDTTMDGEIDLLYQDLTKLRK